LFDLAIVALLLLLAVIQLIGLFVLSYVARELSVIQITLFTAIEKLGAPPDFSGTHQKALGAAVSSQGRQEGGRGG